jgi:hypothetical protein
VLTGAFQSNKYLAKPSAERLARLVSSGEENSRIIDSDVSYAGNFNCAIGQTDLCVSGISGFNVLVLGSGSVTDPKQGLDGWDSIRGRGKDHCHDVHTD